MRRYERHVKAADEETSDEQQVAAVPERLPYRVTSRHRRHVGVLLPPTALQGRGEHGYDHHRTGQQEERGLPAVVREERLPERGEHELAERTSGGGETHGLRAPVLRNEPSQRGDNDGERRAREPQADEHAGREVEGQRGRAHGHEGDAGGIDDAAGGEHAGRSVTVSHRPGEGLPDAPDEVLDRYGQGEDFGRPTAPLVYRC